MIRFLQKRKFRIVTRWKLALKDNAGVQSPAHGPFPYTLTFRAFDQIVHALKHEAAATEAAGVPSILRGFPDESLPSADQYMELFLSGRDVLGEIIDHDPSFIVLFPEGVRHELHAACERVLKNLIDREMREHARRSAERFPRGEPSRLHPGAVRG